LDLNVHRFTIPKIVNSTHLQRSLHSR
jgi:hypothetical protein